MVSTPFKTYNYPCKIPTLCACGGKVYSNHKKTNIHQKYEYNISRGIITINK